MIRPAVGVGRDVMTAFVIAAIDQDIADAGCTHFAEGDFLRVGSLHVLLMQANCLCLGARSTAFSDPDARGAHRGRETPAQQTLEASLSRGPGRRGCGRRAPRRQTYAGKSGSFLGPCRSGSRRGQLRERTRFLCLALAPDR
jgi:hypothetical protein